MRRGAVSAGAILVLVLAAMPNSTIATHWSDVVYVYPELAYRGGQNRFTITVHNAADETLSVRYILASFCGILWERYVFRQDDGTSTEVPALGSRGFQLDIDVAEYWPDTCPVTVYVVGMTTSDSGPQTVTYVATIHTTAVAPIHADLDVAPTRGTAPLVVSFKVVAGGGVAPLSNEWSFGDGTTSTLREVQHTYKTPGSFSVTVVVTDARGRTLTLNKTILVEAFSILDSPLLGLTVLGAFLGGTIGATVYILRRGRRRAGRGLS